MTEIQRRYVPRGVAAPKLEERSDGDPPRIVGYAAVFYRSGDPTTEYEMFPAQGGLPRVVERMTPTAFNCALAEDDVRGLVNHDPSMILGRTGAGTLRLSVDSIGLRYEIDPPDTQAARDLIQSLRRGDITGSSFGFLPRGNVRREEPAAGAMGTDATHIIERTDVQLFDVGPVTFPAYSGASAGVRSATFAAERGEVERWRGAAAWDALQIELLLSEIED